MPEAGIHPLYPNAVCEVCEHLIAAGERMKPRKNGWAHSECLAGERE